MLAPILVTVYNRLEHFQKCIESLKRCELASESILYISSDAAYRREDESLVECIRKYSYDITGFKEIKFLFQNSNKGLVECYNESLEKIFYTFDRLIFLEDDIVVSRDFLKYMNDGLDFYENESRVLSVSGFSHTVFFNIVHNLNQIYFTNRWNPWGFATWKNKFLSIPEYSMHELENDLRNDIFIKKLNSIGMDLLPAFKRNVKISKMLALDYLTVYHMVKNDLVTVTPYSTKTFNTGNDGSGSRTRASKRYTSFDINRLDEAVEYLFSPFACDKIDNSFNANIHSNNKSKLKNLLLKTGLLNIAYYLLEKKEKWKK